jgi:hypothetical protein
VKPARAAHGFVGTPVGQANVQSGGSPPATRTIWGAFRLRIVVGETTSFLDAVFFIAFSLM